MTLREWLISVTAYLWGTIVTYYLCWRKPLWIQTVVKYIVPGNRTIH